MDKAIAGARSWFVRLLHTVFGGLLALLILFEEWGWDALQALMARLASWPPLTALERRIARLPPYAALAVLLLPALTLLPLKLLGLWLLSRGQVMWSLLLVIASKLLGTAVLAHLFALTRPALMRLGWFARGYARWTAWKSELLAWVRATPVWQAAARARQNASRGLRRWLQRWRRG